MGEQPEDAIDLTDVIPDDEIQALFDAIEADAWDEVDALIDAFEKYGYYQESKAGGADRNRGGAEKLRKYWTVGVGGGKIGWGSGGDWTRCVSLLSKHLGVRAKGYCALRHKEMNGYYPGDKRNQKSLNTSNPGYHLHESKNEGATMTTTTVDIPTVEHKAVGVKGINVVDDKQGIVTTIISVTGVVDRVNDLIQPGAYEKTLAQRTPKGIWSHDWNEPVSRTLSVKELMPGDAELPQAQPNGQPWPEHAGGLQVKTQFNLETQRGREAFSDVVFFGDEQEWSIGYHVPVGGAKVDPSSGVRTISTLDLYEYSPVLFGAMSLARTTSVKDAQEAFRTFKATAPWLGGRINNKGVDAVNIPAEAVGIVDTDASPFDEPAPGFSLSDDQVDMLRTAVGALQDLVMSCKDAGIVNETKGDPWGTSWAAGDEDDSSWDDNYDDGDEGEADPAETMPAEDSEPQYDNAVDTVENLLEGIVPGPVYRKLMKLCTQFDVQMGEDDPTKMRDVSRGLLDVIQESLGESAGRDHILRMFASEMAKFIQVKQEQETDEVDLANLPDPEPKAQEDTPDEAADSDAAEAGDDTEVTPEDPADESTGEDAEDAPEKQDDDEDDDPEKKVVLSVTEIKAFVDSFNNSLH